MRLRLMSLGVSVGAGMTVLRVEMGGRVRMR